MSTVICDASPLIFLAKLDRLNLIPELFAGPIVVLQCVAREVISPRASPRERASLERFLESVQVTDVPLSEVKTGALSACDQTTLDWAIQNKAAWLIADERLLRRIALANGIAVAGFLGILIESAKRGLITRKEARTSIDKAISQADCRISISLYQRLIAELDSLSNGL